MEKQDSYMITIYIYKIIKKRRKEQKERSFFFANKKKRFYSAFKFEFPFS